MRKYKHRILILLFILIASWARLLAQGVQPPFFDNFDGPDLWTPDSISGSPWQRGAPPGSFPSTVPSSPNVWYVGLDSLYLNGTYSYLISPKFDFTNVSFASLSFMSNFNTEPGWDGFRLEYSTDSIAWLVLGSVGDPNAVNWYSDPELNCSNLPAWHGNSTSVFGNSNGWIISEYNLGSAGLNNLPEIWFRFYFCSDGSVIYPGLAIDDFRIMELPDTDAGIIAFNSFSNPNVSGTCVDLFPVVKNLGALPLTQVTIHYSVNGGPVNSFPWSGNLAPSDTISVPVGCYTVPLGDYIVCAWTSAPGDSIAFNDTTCQDATGVFSVSASVCYDMEVNLGEFFTLFPNQWEHGTPAYGATAGAHSGNNAWDIKLTVPYAINTRDTLYTPVYQVNTTMNPMLLFWQNRNTVYGLDGFWMEYRPDNSTSWLPLGSFNDVNTINWHNTPLLPATSLSAWSGSSNGWKQSLYFLNHLNTISNYVQFRIIFLADFTTGNMDGVSIDDFCVNNASATDAGALNIATVSGNNMIAGFTDTIGCSIVNYGYTNLTSTDIYYSINGGPATGPFSWTGNLAPGIISNTVYLTSLPFVVPAGNFNICVWTENANDNNAINDSSYSSHFGAEQVSVTFSSPYCNDFNNDDGGWIATTENGNPQTTWQWGTPSFGVTTGAHSGQKCWDTNLNSAYQNSANAILYTPYFEIPANGNPQVSFYQNRNTEQNWDGVRMEYSIYGSQGWFLLGSAGAPVANATNWYNMPSIICSSLPAWAGNSNTWIQSIYKDLGFLNGTFVRFRFVFCSDASVTIDGFSLDDFCLSLAAPESASPVSLEINTSLPLYFPGQCYDFTTSFTNTGVNDLVSLDASLYVDGVPVSTSPLTFNPVLPTGIVSPDFTFPGCWTATPGTHEICVITSNPNGGIDYAPYDDTLCIQITVFGQQDITGGGSYCQDFESAATFYPVHGITYAPVSSWQYGLPNKSFLNDANSGTKAWVTKLAGSYPANDNSALLSEVFVLNTNTTYSLQVFMKFQTEIINDGGTFQYSTDFGNSWTTLGSHLDAQWMNTPNVISINPNPPPNISGWSGTSPWQQVTHPVCFPSTQGTVPINVLFRFLFMSDIFTQSEGWEIDDFCIGPDPAICTVGIQDNLTAGQFTAYCAPNPSRDHTQLYFALPGNGQVAVTVCDVTGKVVKKVEAEYSSGLHSLPIQTSLLNPGIYFYTVQWKDESITGKIVVSGK